MILSLAQAAPGADPQLSSWYLANSGKYARIYTSTANRTAGVSATTWTNGTQTQSAPAYAGVNEINYSTNWVYLRTTGLAGHIMGPWSNPNLPKNQGLIYRFPRTPTIPTTKSLTGLSAIGVLVDGVAIYDTRDAFSYKNASATDASPVNGLTGDGIWNRDAWINEGSSFDAAYAHQPQSGQYHCHANPFGLRYLLGDNVLYNGLPENNSPKTYSENTAATTFAHSPILGWINDGLPMYGPYGYDGGSTGATASASVSGGAVTALTVTAGGSLYQNAPLVTFSGGGGSGAAGTAVLTGGVVTAITITSAGSGYTTAPTVTLGGVRRMISGYVKRDGTKNTTNLNTTGRTTLPAWAASAQNRSATLAASQYGPNVNATYTLGHYIEDYDYLGDLGYTQGSRANAGGVLFDLNKYNVRFCVTPEFPNGTYAYFVSIEADGTPYFPYNVGRWYFGNATGGTSNTTTMNADTPLTRYFTGGANLPITPSTPSVSNGTVSLTWSSVEGGTYSVDASTNQSTWTSKKTGLASGGTSTNTTFTTIGSSGTEYARVNRTALATYDANGQTAATVSQSAITSYSIPAANTAPTITSVANQSILQNSNTGALALTVGDAETAAASLTLSGSSSNTTLVPNASIVFGGSGASRTVTVTPTTGQSGTSTITLTVSDGTLTATASFLLTVNANTAPTISSIASQAILQNSNTGALAFTVGDAETAAASLTLSGSSSNTTLVPNASIVFGGSGASRTVTVTPATGQSGTSTITITVSDGITTTSTGFLLTVSAPNTPPTISSIANQFVLQSTATGALAFTVSDAETAAASLTVSGASSNTTLVPNASIVLGGSGANRTVTVTPAAGQAGAATITLTVSDGSSSANTSFLLTVTAATTNNILFIIADDFGIDASALYNSSVGASVASTPNLAALAAAGVRFTNAYAYPVCSPSRAAMLTGRYGFRTGVGNVVSTAAANSLSSTEFTLPDAFAANSGLGYALKHFGKWHLTAGIGTSVNMSPCTVGGWPAFAGSTGGAISSYTSWTKVISDGTAGGTNSGTSTTYATTDTVNDAVSWIQSQNQAAKPWLAWVAFNAPHTPFHMPSPASLCPDYASLSGSASDITANPRSYYNAAVQAMDTEIGRLLASVNPATTTVIFVGDNGTPAQVLQTPYPSGHGKDTLYEGGVRVPLLIRGPAVVSPGRTSDVLTHVVDLYSTILEIAGISPSATVPATTTLDSQSLLAVLKNQSVTRTRLFTESFDSSQSNFGGVVLRDDRYKLLRNKGGADEFYDLQTDPWEATNLIAAGTGSLSGTQKAYYDRLRFNLGRYNAATSSGPSSYTFGAAGFSLSVPQSATATQSLWRCTDLSAGFWSQVSGASALNSGGFNTFTDPAPPSGPVFYSILAETP